MLVHEEDEFLLDYRVVRTDELYFKLLEYRTGTSTAHSREDATNMLLIASQIDFALQRVLLFIPNTNS